MAAKKTPMRMCVACREMKPKRELIRIVRTPENEICADTTGRAAGRGAYICKSQACLEKAIKIRALERALDKNGVYRLCGARKEAEKRGLYLRKADEAEKGAADAFG